MRPRGQSSEQPKLPHRQIDLFDHSSACGNQTGTDTNCFYFWVEVVVEDLLLEREKELEPEEAYCSNLFAAAVAAASEVV